MRKRKIIISLIVALSLCAAAVATATSGIIEKSRGVKANASAPGASHSASSINRIDPESNPPANVVAFVQSVSHGSAGDAAAALRSLRKLQGGLGAGKTDLYAFDHGDGGLCVLLEDWAATCPVAATNTPGLEWLVAGGHPVAVDGALIHLPTSVAGIAADNISGLKLLNGSAEFVLPIRNNSFFRPLPQPEQGKPWDLRLQVTYMRGGVTTIVLPDPRPAT